MKKLGLTSLFLCFFASLYSQSLRKANKLYEKKAYLEATTLFSNVQPKNQEVYEKLGNCYFFISDMENASETYKQLMDAYEDSTSPIYYYRYSQALYGEDNYIEASKWLEKYYSNKLKNTYIDNISEDYEYLKNKNSSFTLNKIPSNTELSEFGGAFLNNKIVFASSNNNKGSKYSWDKEPYLNLFIADIDNRGGLKNITPFSEEINSKRHESNAVFTKDGKTMYFTASNRNNIAKNEITHLKIYRAELIDNRWQNITDLSINDDNYSTEHPALNKDENKLYFSSDRPGSIGSFDIYVVDILEDGKLGKPKNLGNKINTGRREQFPFIHQDTLFFASTGHFGLGGLDVFRSTIKDDTFSTPRNLGAGINSPLDDFAFVINKNNSYGYLSSNREGGVGSDDIYLLKRIEKVIVNAIIKDSKTSEPIGNTSIELVKNKKDIKNFVSNSDGTFDFQIENLPTNIYHLKVSKALYKPLETSLDIEKINSNEPYVVYLEKKDIVVKNNKIQIQHQRILFDLNSSYLTPNAKIILDHIVEVLNKYPKIVIRCESHTDSRATDTYNLMLSKKRAKRTADYIISKGISSNRITQEGYGEGQLLNKCSNNIPCSEEEHQMNRRTEFVLIGGEKK